MLQIPTTIWNEIAPMTRHPQWRRLFSMDRETLGKAMQALSARLEAEGVDPAVALAYRELAPQLQERQAIATYSRTSSTPLPEILSTNEALMLSIQDHQLRASQTKVLRKLLDGPPLID